MPKQRVIEAVLKFKDEFSKGMTGAMSVIQQNSKKYNKIGREVWRVGNKMDKAGQALTRSITMPMVALGTASGKMYMDFESSMAKIQTIADSSGISMVGMADKILDLSSKTGVASKDIAGSVYDAISAGQTTAKGALSTVEAAVNLGKAGFTETGKALDLLTTISNSYGKSAGSMNDISDMLIMTQNRGKLTVDQLADSMGKIIPAAKMNNVGIQDLNASYVALTKNGVPVKESGTMMKSLYNELGKSSSKTAKILKSETGMSFKELTKSGKNVGEVLQIIKKHADKTGKNLGDLFSNVNAKSAAGGLLDYLDDYNEGLKAIQGSAGTTKTALGALKETDTAKLNKGINRLKNDLIKLGSTVLPIVMPYVEKGLKFIDGLAKKFDNLSDSQKKTIVKVAMFTATIGPLLSASGKLTKGLGDNIQLFSKLPAAVNETGSMIGGLSKVFLGIGPSIGGLPAVLSSIATAAAPIAAVAAVVAVLAGAFVYLWKTNDEFRNNMIGIWNQISSTVNGFAAQVKQRMPEMKVAFTNFINTVKPIWDGFCKFMAPLFEGAFKSVLNSVQFITQFLTGMMDVFTGVFTGDGQKILQGLNTIFSAAANFIVNRLQILWSIVVGRLKIIGNGILTAISPIFAGIATTISQKFSAAVTVVKSIFNAITWTFRDAGRVISSSAGAAFNSARTKVSSAMTAISNAVRNKLTSAKSTATGILSSIKSAFSNAFNSIVSKVRSAISKVKSAFNFSWKLPDLKLPHVSVNGGTPPYGIAGKGSLPSFNVEWHKKAYDNPVLLNNPTIFGAAGGNLLGGGEGHGSELVIGLNTLTGALQQAVQGAINAPGGQPGKNISINIPKIADSVVVREDADIDRIAAAMVHQVEIALADYAYA